MGCTFAFVMTPHSLFRRLVSLMLAVLVLAASVGLTVQRHTCRMTGQSKVDVSVAGHLDLRGCGGQLAPAAPVVKDNCCDFSSHLHKLSAPGHELANKILVPQPALLAVWMPAPMWSAPTTEATPGLAGPEWFATDSSPPARGGRGLLAFVCKLVV